VLLECGHRGSLGPQPARIVWVAAVDAFEAADRMRAGTVEGGFILRDECISRIIKFDSKQLEWWVPGDVPTSGTTRPLIGPSIALASPDTNRM
jgi:hypothetical protein